MVWKEENKSTTTKKKKVLIKMKINIQIQSKNRAPTKKMIQAKMTARKHKTTKEKNNNPTTKFKNSCREPTEKNKKAANKKTGFHRRMKK